MLQLEFALIQQVGDSDPIVTVFLEEYLGHCSGDIVTKTCINPRTLASSRKILREKLLMVLRMAPGPCLRQPRFQSWHPTKQFKLASENTTPDISGKESARRLSVYLVEAGKDRKRSPRTGRLHYAFIEHEKVSF